jgi:hypothetical protein
VYVRLSLGKGSTNGPFASLFPESKTTLPSVSLYRVFGSQQRRSMSSVIIRRVSDKMHSGNLLTLNK